jgi:hypothetical protein
VTAAAILVCIRRHLVKDPAKLQDDLFMRPNEDGLFPGFTHTWRAERSTRALTRGDREPLKGAPRVTVMGHVVGSG